MLTFARAPFAHTEAPWTRRLAACRSGRKPTEHQRSGRSGTVKAKRFGSGCATTDRLWLLDTSSSAPMLGRSARRRRAVAADSDDAPALVSAAFGGPPAFCDSWPPCATAAPTRPSAGTRGHRAAAAWEAPAGRTCCASLHRPGDPLPAHWFARRSDLYSSQPRRLQGDSTRI